MVAINRSSSLKWVHRDGMIRSECGRFDLIPAKNLPAVGQPAMPYYRAIDWDRGLASVFDDLSAAKQWCHNTLIDEARIAG